MSNVHYLVETGLIAQMSQAVFISASYDEAFNFTQKFIENSNQDFKKDKKINFWYDEEDKPGQCYIWIIKFENGLPLVNV